MTAASFINADVDTSACVDGMRKFVSVLGIEAPKVIKKETGELIKTLVRLSPAAKDKQIGPSIESKFAATESGMTNRTSRMADMMEKSGHNAVIWYAFSPTSLYGVARNADKTKASVDELEAINRSLTVKGKRRVGQRGKQTVYLSQKILTTPEARMELIERIRKHRGRLKAGWLTAYFEGKTELSGGNMPPNYVMEHRGENLGWVQDDLGKSDYPALTIGNTARGVGKQAVKSIAELAVSVRSKAMAANFALLFSGKKHLSDYAK